MGRYTGSWVGFKCVNETVEQTKTVDLDFADMDIVLPELSEEDVPPEGLHIRPMGTLNPQFAETIVTRYRLPLVKRFVRANRIDRAAFGDKQPKFGIVNVIQALNLIGITEADAKKMKLGVYKVGCIWPLEDEGLLEFSKNAKTLFFAEEKRLKAKPKTFFTHRLYVRQSMVKRRLTGIISCLPMCSCSHLNWPRL